MPTEGNVSKQVSYWTRRPRPPKTQEAACLSWWAMWYSPLHGALMGSQGGSCCGVVCTGKAVPEGRVTKGRDLSQSHSAFNLLQQRPCSVASSGKLATVKKQKHPPPAPQYNFPESLYLQRERDLVRAPTGGSAFHPLPSPRDTRHQPECAPPRRPSPCHS